jgi:hypothetical protein
MKLGIEGMLLHIVQNIYVKLISNIILNGVQLKPFLPATGVRKRYIDLEFLPRATR